MSNEAKKDEYQGRAKKAAGEIADDDELKREGEVDKLKGKAKQTLDKAKDAVDSAADKVTGSD